jgi:hypothetical protein
MTLHIMLDLETLGTKPGAVIRSIGAVAFDPRALTLGAPFYANVDRASCEAIGLLVDPDTEAWWAKQSPEARARLETDPLPIGEAISRFEVFWREAEGRQIWGHGASFDAPILEAAFRALGRRTPWPFSACRDTRTLYEMAGVEPDRTDGLHHDALADAMSQAKAVQAGWRKLLPDQCEAAQ